MRGVALIIAGCLAGSMTGCAVGAPPGYSEGDAWTFPLVGPLEGGRLIVPVRIHDQGPYLFVIDPDAPRSWIDPRLAELLDLRMSQYGPDLIDESDTSRTARTAEVLRLSIGGLTVRGRELLVGQEGAFDTAGRRIRGVIGRDVVSDSLVLGFDRARGVATLATQRGFQRPADAATIEYRVERSLLTTGANRIDPVGRRLTTVTVAGRELTMHLDLGDAPSQLRDSLWAELGLAPVAVERTLTDEVGTRRDVDRGVLAPARVGALAQPDLLLVPYGDRRWREPTLDGALGLDFFDGHAVWANWHEERIYAAPQPPGLVDAVARERIARWGSAKVAACAEPACARARLLPSPAHGPATAPPRPFLHVERDAEVADLPYELLLDAVPPASAPTRLPRLIVVMPPGTRQVAQPLDERYAGATFRVLDVAPFPRACDREGGCVYVLPSP